MIDSRLKSKVKIDHSPKAGAIRQCVGGVLYVNEYVAKHNRITPNEGGRGVSIKGIK